MTTKSTSCLVHRTCQGLGPNVCPDCDSWECEVEIPAIHPALDRRQTPRRFAFAPGVIDGAQPTQAFEDVDEWFPLSLAETLKVVGVLAVLGLVAGYLVERYV